jgi:hypothetical protein
MSTPFDPNRITYFGQTDFRGQKTRFGIKTIDRARHMYVIGKTGTGKSTLLENMAAQDVINGEGFAILDPHGSFADRILEYIPMSRIKDVVYFAPFDTEYPISFNVMEDVGFDKRHLVSSGLMSSFKKIWVDAWSARMEYILNNILLALLEFPDATLLGVNRMLSDKDYRNKVVDNITDPSVKAFWTDEFAKYGERYMQEAGAAIQNKIGQFTSNPLIRNIVGQPKSSFDVRSIMDGQKILLMNLSKGRIGEQNTSLLGSMLITKIYLAAMSRAEVTTKRLSELPPFFFYVDEFQSFANDTFADILSEARKYKLNLIIAHQYVAQMEDKVKDAVFGNVGTTITFRVGPLDAELLEKVFSPQFMSTDLVNLGFAQVYLTLMIDGMGSKPFSATTLGPIETPEISYKGDIIEMSRATFAHTREKVESETKEWYEKDNAPERPMREKKPEEQLPPKPQKDLTQNPYYKKGLPKEETPQPTEQQQVVTPRKEEAKQFSKPYISQTPPKEREEVGFPTKTTSLKDALLSAIAEKEKSTTNAVASKPASVVEEHKKHVPIPPYNNQHKKPLSKTLQPLNTAPTNQGPEKPKEPFKKEERAATDESKRSLREMLEKLNLPKKEIEKDPEKQPEKLKEDATTSPNIQSSAIGEQQEVDPSVVQKLFE